MKELKIYSKVTLFLFGLAYLMSCTKVLDEKPDRSITTISSIEDLRKLINLNTVFNSLGASLADVGADEYVLSTSEFNNFNINYQNAYKWNVTQLNAWNQLYVVVYHANVVIEELNSIDGGTQAERDNLLGQALFFRSMAFYYLAQFYSAPYNSETSAADLGIPLRLTPNVEEEIYRSTVFETYKQVVDDLKKAESLLPMRNGTLNHPGKLAVWGFLSRVYLCMRDYVNAEKYASMYLEISPDLIDYNSLDVFANPSVPMLNAESVFSTRFSTSIPRSSTTINPELIGLYDSTDLRIQILFRKNATTGKFNFKGSYQGIEGQVAYCGIATDEIYLIRAECLIRMDRKDDGLGDLNILLKNRYRDGEFVPAEAATNPEALDIVLRERRKELLFRSARWTDLRRLNLEGYNITLSREVDGTLYLLPPNDKRWVWAIPEEVVKLSGIQQNDR